MYSTRASTVGTDVCRRASRYDFLLASVLVGLVAGCGRLGFDFAPARLADSKTDSGGMDGAAPSDVLPPTGARDAAASRNEAGPDSSSDAGDFGGPRDGAVPPTALGSWLRRDLPYVSGSGASALLSDGLHYLGGSQDYVAKIRYQQHYVYDSATEMWSAGPADIPDTDTDGARAHAYQDRLYLLGGYPSGQRFRVYARDTDQWTSLKAPPVEFQWGFASGVIGHALYAFGGVPGKSTNAAGYKYDFATDTWSPAAPIPLNHGKGTLSSAVVGSSLYVLNGNEDDGSTVLQIYDSSRDSWSMGAGLGQHAVESAAAATIGSRIYFFGGADDHDILETSKVPGVVTSTVDIYDAVTGAWSIGPPMGAAKMWATAQFYAGRFHVLGGLDENGVQMGDHEILE